MEGGVGPCFRWGGPISRAYDSEIWAQMTQYSGCSNPEIWVIDAQNNEKGFGILTAETASHYPVWAQNLDIITHWCNPLGSKLCQAGIQEVIDWEECCSPKFWLLMISFHREVLTQHSQWSTSSDTRYHWSRRNSITTSDSSITNGRSSQISNRSPSKIVISWLQQRLGPVRMNETPVLIQH